MKKYFSPKMGDYFLYRGKLVQHIFGNNGQKAIGFQYVKPEDYPKCPSCGVPLSNHSQVEEIESSPLFQDNAEPLPQESRIED